MRLFGYGDSWSFLFDRIPAFSQFNIFMRALTFVELLLYANKNKTEGPPNFLNLVLFDLFDAA